MSIRDFFDKPLKDIDSKIDSLIKSVPTASIGAEESDDSSGKIIDEFLQGSDDDEVSKMFENVTIPQDRLQRYHIYEEIYRAVPIIKRIVRVYVANILQKNPVDGKSIILKEKDGKGSEDEDERKTNLEKVKKFTEDMLEEFSLLEKLRNKIVPNELVFGDSWVEIVELAKEYDKIEVEKTSSVFSYLGEAEGVRNLNAEINKWTEHPDTSAVDSVLFTIADKLVEIDEDPQIIQFESDIRITEQEPSDGSRTDGIQKQNESKSFTGAAGDILLRIHKPRNIIVLETRYGSKIGYLEIGEGRRDQISNVQQTLSAMVGRITTILSRDMISQEQIVDRIIHYIIKKVLAKAGGVLNSEQAANQLDPSVLEFIKRLIVEQGIGRKKSIDFRKARVRFIPPNRMVTFSISSADYQPYGESIADPLILPSKLYIIAQLSNVITKLSRAALVRKWMIDVGSSRINNLVPLHGNMY